MCISEDIYSEETIKQTLEKAIKEGNLEKVQELYLFDNNIINLELENENFPYH